MKGLALVLALALQGCAMFGAKYKKEGKKEVLLSADEALDQLIAEKYQNCKSESDSLYKLKKKVKDELEKVK